MTISITKHTKTQPIRVVGTFDTGGYGYAVRGLLQALAAVGFGPDVVRFVPAISTSMGIVRHDSQEDSWLEPYFIGDRTVDDKINIVHLNPALSGVYHTSVGGRYNIAYCSWETDRLPKKKHLYHGQQRTVVECLNDYNEVWVPTTHSVDVFKQSGVTVPIYVIPHTLQESLLAVPPRDHAPIYDERTTFYCIGSWNLRKNTQGVVRAYWDCGWGPASPVQLILHQVPANRTPDAIETHQLILRDELSVLKNGYPEGKDAQLLLHATPKPYSWILKLHGQGHILVSAARGEGFAAGLPALEALAMGNYVIGGGGPALQDLAELVPGSVTVLPYLETPVEPMLEGFELDQLWWSVRQQDLRNEMRSLHTFVREEGLPLPEDVEKIRDTYSPQTTGKLILARLEHAYNTIE